MTLYRHAVAVWSAGEMFSRPVATARAFRQRVIDARLEQHAADIDWKRISDNPHVTEEVLARHPDKPWHYNVVSRTSSASLTTPTFTTFSLEVFKSLHVSWVARDVARMMSMHPRVQASFILENENLPWDWYYVSLGPAVAFRQHVEPNLHLPWRWNALSFNPSVTLEDVRRHRERPWNFNALSYSLRVTIEDVLDSIDEFPWDWYGISMNPHISLEDVLDHPGLPWDWGGISFNASVDFEKHVLANIDLPWNWTSLTSNPSVSFRKHVLSNLGKPWNWHYISKGHDEGASATLRDVLDHPTLPWSWFFVTQNPSVRLDDVLARPELPWDMSALFNNPSLRYEDLIAQDSVISFPKPLLGRALESVRWHVICGLPSFLEPTTREKERYIAARTIYRLLCECYTNPAYAACRRRLLRDYETTCREAATAR